MARGAAALALALALLVSAARWSIGAHVYSSEEIRALRGKRCTNLGQVQAAVNFADPDRDPYPALWYDTEIDFERDCYVVYPSAEDRSSYELQTMSAAQVEAYAPGRHFLTHRGQCGVCSQLDDLAVYLETRDLTSAVRSCTLRMIKGWTLSCLEDLGFTKECRMIWYWNTANTKKTTFNGGCFGVCVAHMFSDNNQPVGNYNPCKPTREIRERELQAVAPAGSAAEAAEAEPEMLNSLRPGDPRLARKGAELCLPLCVWGKCQPCCMPAMQNREDGLCKNTINGRPTCAREQWENGPYRLNPCLQCDECRSGPVFQRVAGRTRRASGIISAIDRPGVTEIVHSYG